MDKHLKWSFMFNLPSKIWFYSISHKLCCDTWHICYHGYFWKEPQARHGKTTYNTTCASGSQGRRITSSTSAKPKTRKMRRETEIMQTRKESQVTGCGPDSATCGVNRIALVGWRDVSVVNKASSAIMRTRVQISHNKLGTSTNPSAEGCG